MKSENSKISEPHILILKLSDKTDLRRGAKSIPFIKPSYLLHMEKHKKIA